VEDELSVQRGLARVFNRFGAAVVASNLEEACDEVARRPFTGYVLDVRLPDGSGLDLLAQLRVRDLFEAEPPRKPLGPAGLPALVYTGHADPWIEKRARSLHATILEKPAPQEELERFAARAVAAEILDVPASALVADLALEHRLSVMQIRILSLEVASVARARWSEELGAEPAAIEDQVRRILSRSSSPTLFALAQPIIQEVMTGRPASTA
jgi:CheY-like chemotaxis protein